MPKSKEYYCNSCLSVQGDVVTMRYDPARHEHSCPNCKSRWRLNKGQARHEVSKQLKKYQALADKLGVD